MGVELSTFLANNQVLTLSEYQGVVPSYQMIELPKRGVDVPDIRRIYSKQGLWKELSVGIVGRAQNPLQARVTASLLDHFSEQEHDTYTALPNGKLEAPENIDILLAHLDIPLGRDKLVDRIPDDTDYIALQVKDQFGLRKNPGHLVGVTTIPERLSETSHEEVAYIARRLFFRMGIPSAIFISQAESGEISELTLVTPEGGSISIPANNYENALRELRDSLVTLEMATDLPTVEHRPTSFSLDEFESSPFPTTMITAGPRLDQMGYLRPPIKATEHTTNPKKLKLLQLYLGSQQWAEAAWLTVDPSGSILPDIGTIYMTATGGDGADKRHPTEQDVVPVGEVRGGKLQVFPVPGKETRKSSVEARELSKLIIESPKIRLKKVNGFYIPDLDGEFVTSVWAAFLHLHVGYDQVDPRLVEHLAPNINIFPYGVGCGTDLMELMSQDNARRAEEIMQYRKPLMFIWPVNRHGIIVAVPWERPIQGMDGNYHQGLETALELIDPNSYGAVRINPHNIPQFPQGIWPQ